MMYCENSVHKRRCTPVKALRSLLLTALLAGCSSTVVKESSHARVAVTPLLSQAVADRQSGRLGQAESALNRAMRIAPASPDIYYQMAVLRERQGQNDQARQLAQRALGLNPGYRLEQKIEHFLRGLSI